MKATFGKLEEQTLLLKPGLNVITAPNEWGKSTWCAFLLAMLYGLDTRAKTTRTALADKEHYAPWSGRPMEGRIDLNWNGRDITIERRTRRRIPMGEFRAYETDSGLPVPELTGANCGQLLLGVEQSVFRRAGFIRHGDLPVTQDEALRRRLNDLVTTGDESGSADRLAAELKELKNCCRYNRSGLLPQTEAERDALEAKLNELQTLDAQSKKTMERLEELKGWLGQLYNHRQALAYQAAESTAAHLAQAREDREQTLLALAQQEQACAQLPSREEAEQKIRDLRTLREDWIAMQNQTQNLPPEPREPQLPLPFAGMEPEQARRMVEYDTHSYLDAGKTKMPLVLMAVGLLGLVTAGTLVVLKVYLFAGLAAAAALTALIWGVAEGIGAKRRIKTLQRKYFDPDCRHWADPLEDYEETLAAYQQDLRMRREASGDVEVRWMVLRKRRESLCGQQDPEALLESWQKVLDQWNAYGAARREAEQAQTLMNTLSSMVRPVEKPAQPDELTQTEEQTAQLVTECALEQQRLQNRLGQYQGRMAALGDRERLQKQLGQKNQRIAQLEDLYGALSIAQETLEQARRELQRRFAPRITRRAQELLERMTGGRYHSLTMGEDFSLQSGAGQETTLHEILWRSDGTMDQLYLALRLAVAEELTPQAPLILDDALVRFDDVRLKAAMAILKELAQSRQVICFTCQSREQLG